MSFNNQRPNRFQKRSDSMSNVLFNNPFDFSAYPMTNPPLFDQSMFVNYGHDGTPTLRRRISISNGQIGQIINNEAIFDDSYDMISQDTTPVDLNDKQNFQLVTSNEQFAGPNIVHISHHQQPSHATESDVVANPPIQQHVVYQGIPGQSGSSQPPHGMQSQHYSADQPNPTVVVNSQGQPDPTTVHGQSTVPPIAQIHATIDLTASPTGDVENHNSFAGVPPPNHQLIYNNEVIFNPNNGPIPGTAAWKRDRLLERNRIAASKCRKRKKQAQQQLSEDLNDLKIENSHLREKLDNYDKFFKLTQSFFNKSSNFENVDSSANEFELITKALKSRNQQELFQVLQDYHQLDDPHIKQEPDS